MINEKEKIKAVGYCRFSSSNQREESISAQKRVIEYYAQSNGYKILEWYVDREESGKTVDRPDFQRLLSDSKKGIFERVIVHKLDRFSRSVEDTQHYSKLLRDYGVRLVSVSESIDDTPMGRTMMGMLSTINEYYINNLSTEVLKGQKENAHKALWNGGIPPLGYDVVDKKLIINEAEAEIVSIIFNMSAEGYGYGQIIDKLNLLGYKTKKGNTFGKNSLYDLLCNERYKGTYVFNKRASANHRNKRNNHSYKPEDEIIRLENGCPAIVSEELWNKANAIRKLTGKYYTNAKRPYLLTGWLYCEECGAKMHGNFRKTPSGEGYTTYRCNNRSNKRCCKNKEIKTAYLDDFVLNQLFEYFFKERMIPEMTKQLNACIKEKYENDADLKALKGNQKNLKKMKENFLSILAKEGNNHTIFEELQKVEAQLKACDEKIAEYERKKNLIFTTEQVKAQLTSFKAYLQQSKNTEQIKYLLDSFLDKIVVGESKITIYFKVCFGNDDDTTISIEKVNQIDKKRLNRGMIPIEKAS